MENKVVKVEDELLDPRIYPEEQRELVEDFNSRLKLIMGIVTALGKEYHTIWLVNRNDLTMHLYRSTGKNTTRGAVELGYKYNNYDKFIRDYIDIYVVDNTESIQQEVCSDVIFDKIGKGELYTVDYMRMSDESELTYHQMAFALAGCPDNADYFTIAFRDIDKSIRRHISDKRYLREQLDIVAALSRDYYNIFKVDINTGNVVILKLDGYVTKGMDAPSDKVYPYDVLYKQYVKDRVYSEDQPAMLEAMSLETVYAKMQEQDEYVSSYRVIDNGEIHYYQFTYIPVNPGNPASAILAGFKNVDDIVESAKEREALAVLAETDIMTGILNRGSGERKVIDALANGRIGMFCILDIDDFKNINDHFGHSVGDKVIRGIADIISNEFRERDIVFRLGGDEYAVFALNVVTKDAAETIIERVFAKIGEMDLPELGGRKVTVSVGATITNPDHKFGFETVYKLADSCVYKSKAIDGCAVTFDGSCIHN
ncbi:MAG: GGDEF domain-containing protein [Lachnospiraceae bacterium]|nr:GGDEF domain-containing protein [Lachnospiraceae bacterium]